jgi:hypothetical protein
VCQVRKWCLMSPVLPCHLWLRGAVVDIIRVCVAVGWIFASEKGVIVDRSSRAEPRLTLPFPCTALGVDGSLELIILDESDFKVHESCGREVGSALVGRLCCYSDCVHRCCPRRRTCRWGGKHAPSTVGVNGGRSPTRSVFLFLIPFAAGRHYFDRHAHQVRLTVCCV